MKKATKPLSLAFESYQFAPESHYSALYSEQSTDWHTHSDFYEFSLMITGSFENTYNGKNYHLDKGTLIFFKPNISHSLQSSAPNSLHFSFIIKTDLMNTLFKQLFPNWRLSQLSDYIERQLSPSGWQYLSHIANQLMNNSIRSDREQWMHQFLFISLSSCLMAPQTLMHSDSVDQYVADLLTRLNSYVYLHHKVSEIYIDYPLAPSILIARFKQHTGYTIVQYHTMKKLDYAAQLLASSKPISITEVCAELNISCLSYFSKIFKERFKVTPKEYQRLHARYRVPDENTIGANY